MNEEIMRRKEKNVKTDTYGYSDLFFEKGNYIFKIKQICYSLIGWVFFFVPSTITILNYLYFISPKQHGVKFWEYKEGFQMINLLIILFVFAAFITLVYTATMTIIQNNRRESFVEKWPTFDLVSSIERQNRASQFMTERFGIEEFRTEIRYFEVTPDKNLQNNELSRIINKEDN